MSKKDVISYPANFGISISKKTKSGLCCLIASTAIKRLEHFATMSILASIRSNRLHRICLALSSSSTIIALIAGAVIAFYITGLPSLASNTNSYFLFIAGAIAICAMILPGISGSFILVILGAYKTLSDAFHDFDIKKIALFASGAIVGLLSFSRVLKWLFKNYHNLTLALLTGFILGSLNKVWPYKKTLKVMEDTTGNIVDFETVSNFGTLGIYQKSIQNFDSYKMVIEQSISPSYYAEINQVNAQLPLAIGLMVVGFLTIFILEKVGNKPE